MLYDRMTGNVEERLRRSESCFAETPGRCAGRAAHLGYVQREGPESSASGRTADLDQSALFQVRVRTDSITSMTALVDGAAAGFPLMGTLRLMLARVYA